MSNNTLLIRSRFQPFTKFHAELINEAIKKNTAVGLCIIRDYETITVWHRIKKDIGATDLRHLPIFNPFTSWEVVKHVRACLQLYGIDHSMPIVVSPIKYVDLIRVSKSLHDKQNEQFIAPTLERFIKPDTCGDEKFQKCTAIRDFDNIVSLFTYDMLPNSFEYSWFFPSWDKEDDSDFEQAHNNVTRANCKAPAHMLTVGNMEFNMGLYGQFLCWLYFRFIKAYHGKKGNDLSAQVEKGLMPNGMQNEKILTNIIGQLKNILSGYVPLEEFKMYDNKVEKKISILLNDFNSIPETESALLLNFHMFSKFVRTTVEASDQKN